MENKTGETSGTSPPQKRNAFAAMLEASKKSEGGTKSSKQMKLEDDMAADAEKFEKLLTDMKAKPADDFCLCIISKGRSGNVKKMRALCAPAEPIFVVAKGEEADYRAAGAQQVVEGGKLCASRNRCIALAAERNKICCEMSDDLKSVRVLVQPDGTTWEKPADLSAANKVAATMDSYYVSALNAARYLECFMREESTHLGGAFPTPNDGQAVMTQPTSKELFVVGDFLVINPASTPRFDELMTLKEDYDLTAQHLATYKKVTRCNRLLVVAEHYDNAGGAVADRAQLSKEDRRTVPDEKEQFNIAVLRHKWPGVFPQHGTRGVNEVRMAWNMRGKMLNGKEDIKRPPAPEGWKGNVVDTRPSKSSFFGALSKKTAKDRNSSDSSSSSSSTAELGSSKTQPVSLDS